MTSAELKFAVSGGSASIESVEVKLKDTEHTLTDKGSNTFDVYVDETYTYTVKLNGSYGTYTDDVTIAEGDVEEGKTVTITPSVKYAVKLTGVPGYAL